MCLVDLVNWVGWIKQIVLGIRQNKLDLIHFSVQVVICFGML